MMAESLLATLKTCSKRGKNARAGITGEGAFAATKTIFELPVGHQLILIVTEGSNVFDQVANLLFRQPGVQESMGVSLVVLSLSRSGVEILIAHLLHRLRSQVRHLHLGGRSRMTSAIGRVTNGALLRIHGILSAAQPGDRCAESHKDNDPDQFHYKLPVIVDGSFHIR